MHLYKEVSFLFFILVSFCNLHAQDELPDIRSLKADYSISDAQIKILSAEFYDAEKDSILVSTTNLEKRITDIVLPYTHNYFDATFDISEAPYANAFKIQYQLEGKQSKWIDLREKHNLRLIAIPPGKYILRVRGVDETGSATTNEMSIPITVEDIFYKEWWFFILNILVVGLLIAAFYRFRMYRWTEKLNQQRKVDQLESKALRAQMNPHFMFNALNGLQSTMILKGEREANKYLGAFSRMLRSSIDMSKSDTISLEEEIQYLEAYLSLESLRQARPFESSILLIPEDMDVQSISIPCMLFQPIIENAIIHGLSPKREGTPNLSVVFKEDGDQIIGIVTDNGIGREAAAVLKASNRKTYKSWATVIMKERIEIINRHTDMTVDFTIKDLYADGVAIGTEVTLTLPIQ
jgi:two-component sensor histidine kinase